ncbi:MAG: DUF2442 domain-containing protein [Acidobacteriota bacterium]
MTSLQPGARTSADGVTGIGEHGFWLLAEGREYFVPFSDYPAFLEATAREIFDVRFLGGGQLRWPALDIYIEIAALDRPDEFPLAFGR